MSRARRLIALFCLAAALPGCGRGGVVIGVLLVRTALAVAAATAGNGDGDDCDDPRPELPPPGPMDHEAVNGVLAAAAERVRGCARGHAGGPRGPGVAQVLVMPSGEISQVVLWAPFAGTAVGQCISEEIIASAVKPYEGEAAVIRLGFLVD